MVEVIETAKIGKPVGFRYGTLAEVAHHLFHQRPELLKGFGFVLRAYGHCHLLAEQGASGKWASKVALHREAIRREPRFQLDRRPVDEQFVINRPCPWRRIRIITIPDTIQQEVSGMTDPSGAPIRDLGQYQSEWNNSFVFVEPGALAPAEWAVFADAMGDKFSITRRMA